MGKNEICLLGLLVALSILDKLWLCAHALRGLVRRGKPRQLTPAVVPLRQAPRQPAARRRAA